VLQKIAKYIAKEKLLNNGGQVIVGLSGGGDSVMLLHALHQLGYQCIAAHCNFNLRGEESERDKNFAENFAGTLQIPFRYKTFNTVAIARERKISIEMAARELRYQWFEELRQSEHADATAVAHHRDDSIETLLLNLIRGTGIHGLTGISPRNGHIIRPLLTISKTEIIQYLNEANLDSVTDSTNLQDEFTRNKIRLKLLPMLETINPSIKEGLLNTAQNIAEAVKIYDSAIEHHISTIFNKQRGTINIPLLKQCPSPRSVTFEILKNYGFSSKTIAGIYKTIDSQPGKTFRSPTYHLTRDRDEYIITPVTDRTEPEEYKIAADCRRLELPLKINISVTVNYPSQTISKSKNTASLDLDKLQFPLTLRRWRPGDRFKPFGMNRFQKLSDFFNNNHISRPEKDSVWVLQSGQDIAWVVNHRTDNRFRVEESTDKIFNLEIIPG
jgi:tRNA(Ile)-lysidine synthase